MPEIVDNRNMVPQVSAGELLRMARRYLDQVNPDYQPPPRLSAHGPSSAELIWLLAKFIEKEYCK